MFRALPCQGRGRELESLRSHHFLCSKNIHFPENSRTCGARVRVSSLAPFFYAIIILMFWLVYVVINIFSDSTRIYTDNYISDVYFKGRGSVAQKCFFSLFYFIVGLIFATCFGLNFSSVSWTIVACFFLSGVLNALAGIPYYKALEIEDSTNLGIFIQLSPVLYLIFGCIFLGDTISPLQALSFVIILLAPLLIVLTSRKRSRHVKFRALLFAFLYVLIDVIGNLIFVSTNSAELNFLSEMAVVFFGIGFGNLLIVLCLPKLRARFHRVLVDSHNKALRPLIFSGFLSVAKTLSYRLALVSAPAVALASVVADATEPIVIFFMGLVLTLIRPIFGRENLAARSIIVHLIATALVVVGIVLIQL